MNHCNRSILVDPDLVRDSLFGTVSQTILIFILISVLLNGCSNALEQTSNNSPPQDQLGDKPKRVSRDLILLYEFKEGVGSTANETSGYSTGQDNTPLNLTIFDESFVSWLDVGLHVGGSVQIKSLDGVAVKLQSAVVNTEEVTIESWLNPANLKQGSPDPACIFSYAGDTTTHNFRLAQAGGSYSVDFRTTDTNNNYNNAKGQPSLISPAGSVKSEITHVVMTWSNASGEINLYINGAWTQNLPRIGKVFQGWEGTLPLRLGYELAPDGSLANTWQGDVYLIAMYNRVLTDDEIYQNFQAGYHAI